VCGWLVGLPPPLDSSCLSFSNALLSAVLGFLKFHVFYRTALLVLTHCCTGGGGNVAFTLRPYRAAGP
jgi:hypothetical protein